MPYDVRNFDNLLGIEGLSEILLKNHFSLYQGYVKNINSIINTLKSLFSQGKERSIEFGELKRRFGWEWNGMRLHELYFGIMSKNPKSIDKSTNLYKKIVKEFGTYQNWEKEFKAIGMMRGIGWTMLNYDSLSGNLFNIWIDEHNVNQLTGVYPILVMDMFEHAFNIDYGIDKEKYINTFFKLIDWTIDPLLDSWIGQI